MRNSYFSKYRNIAITVLCETLLGTVKGMIISSKSYYWEIRTMRGRTMWGPPVLRSCVNKVDFRYNGA